MMLPDGQQEHRCLPHDERPRLTLHHVGFDPLSLHYLRVQLDALARELPVVLSLQSGGGEVVLVDEHVARTMPAQVLHAFCEGRTCVTVARNPPQAGMVRGAIAAQQLRQAMLALIDTMQQGGVTATPAAAPADRSGQTAGFDSGPDSGPDSGFDARLHQNQYLADKPLDPRRQEMLHRLHRAWLHAEGGPLCVSYGPKQSILFDFSQGLVWAEPAALPCLRMQRELPHPASISRLASSCVVRELDQALWDLAAAAGPHALLDAPADWWHTTIEPLSLESVTRLSNLPLQRELARALAGGGTTPSRLRRESRASVSEIRCFLQACLYLGLARWAPGPVAPPGRAPAEPR